MCDLNIARPEILTGMAEPFREECCACRQRLLIEGSQRGNLGNPGSITNEARDTVPISRCPHRSIKEAQHGGAHSQLFFIG
jgi:hypothetical protein